MVKRQEKTKPEAVASNASNVEGSDCKKKKYKGVRMRSWGSWVSEIRAPNQKTRIWLGSYSSPEAAARAYDAALLCLKKGSSTNLNFPSTSITYHQHCFDDKKNNIIMSPKSIQRIAAAAAAAAVTSPVPPSTTMMSVDDISKEVNETVYMNENWCEFESPKYLDMVNEFFFNPVVINDYVYEECDIRLWSFDN